MADEKIIQITDNAEILLALTNQGRLFQKVQGININEWEEIDLPPLNKTKPRSQTKSEVYSEDFEHLWLSYGKQGNKKAANRQYEARLKEESYTPAVYLDIETGIASYNEFIKATGQYKKNFETFIGRDKHYLNDFTIPEQAKKASKPEWAKLPFDENQLEAHAIKHGLQRPGRMDSFQQYRSKLQIEINKRLEE